MPTRAHSGAKEGLLDQQDTDTGFLWVSVVFIKVEHTISDMY